MRAIRMFLALAFLLFSGTTFAAGVTINAGDAPYRNLPDVPGTNINSEVEGRISAMTHMVAAYRDIHGAGSLPTGTIVTFKWQDGSSEKGSVIAAVGSVLAEPIPGTQSKPATGGVGYTNDSGGHYYGGADAIGFRPIYRNQTVCVGDYCESMTVVIGYEWVFAPGRGPGNEAV